MVAYVAFLRGIGPGDPRMTNEKLRGGFESLGFRNVRTLISSGNVLFESEETSPKKLETMIEKMLPIQLGFSKAVLVRSKAELEKFAAKNPFPDMTHSPKTSLNVTFLKRKTDTSWKFPYRGPNRNYTVLGMYDREVYSVIDTTGAKTVNLMAQLEKEFGKDITTRTWLTIQRVLKRFGD